MDEEQRNKVWLVIDFSQRGNDHLIAISLPRTGEQHEMSVTAECWRKVQAACRDMWVCNICEMQTHQGGLWFWFLEDPQA